MGATLAMAVIMLQGGVREVLHATGPLWEMKLLEVMTAVIGGGLLGGCIALIIDRVKH